MTLAVSFSAVGPAALDALAGTIATAKKDDPLAPVTVAVPSPLAGLSARRALSGGRLPGSRPGLAAVTFQPLVRLAELLGAPALASEGRRPVTDPVLAASVRSVLRATAGPWSSVATHPATERAVVTTVAEVRRAPPSAVAALRSRSGSAGSVVRLADRVGEGLRSWYDEGDLYRAAAAAPGEAIEALGSVVVWLPVLPGADAALGFIHALAESARVEVILGVIGIDAVDEPAHAFATRLRPGRPDPVPPAAPAPAPVGTSVTVAADSDEEARAAARRVARWFAEGVPLRRIGIFHPAGVGHALLLHEHLHAAGLPATGPDPRRLRDALAPRVLLELLALPEGNYAREDVLAVLAAAPVLRADGQSLPVTKWDQLSREAGVVAGLEQWQAKLTSLADGHAARVAELRAEDEVSPAWIDKLERDEQHALTLADFVDDLAKRLADPPAEGWRGLADWSRELLKRYLGGASRRSGWPEREVGAAEQLERVLDMLATLDELDTDLPAPTASALRHLLEVELDRPAGRIGRFGAGVLVAPFEAAAGLDLDRIVLVGLAEGVWPHRPGDDPLLADRVRVPAGMAPRGVPVVEQHRRFLAALAAGREERVVSAPAADLRSGRSFEPSRWLLDTVAELDSSTVDAAALARMEEPWLERVASFTAGLRSTAEPSGLADLDLRLLLADADAGVALVSSPLIVDRPELAAGFAVRAERVRAAFTRFDGNVERGIAAAHLDERMLSPTSLERYAACPFRYLLTSVLRVSAVDRPEELDAITPMERGSLVHEVLERFMAEVLERPEAARPGPDDPWTDADRARLDQTFDEVAVRYEQEGRTGRWLRWQHDRETLRRLLHAFLLRDDDYRQKRRARPAAVEMPFGYQGEAPVELRVGDRVLRFHGQADRVDRTDDGEVVVLDYKAGRPDYFKPLAEGDPVARGLRLQLPIYALAAQQRFGGDGPARAGYVFLHESAPVEPVGYAVDERRLRRFRDVVGVLTDGITDGAFPPHPGAYQSFWGTHANCTFCDYDRLCPPDRGDQWESVIGAPALAPYVDLTEGPDVWEPDPTDGRDVTDGRDATDRRGDGADG